MFIDMGDEFNSRSLFVFVFTQCFENTVSEKVSKYTIQRGGEARERRRSERERVQGSVEACDWPATCFLSSPKIAELG